MSLGAKLHNFVLQRNFSAPPVVKKHWWYQYGTSFTGSEAQHTPLAGYEGPELGVSSEGIDSYPTRAAASKQHTLPHTTALLALSPAAGITSSSENHRIV